MLDLSNIFNKDLKKAIISKEKLAEMLRVTPEALKAFEKSYQLHSMNEPISDNLFKVNAKQDIITIQQVQWQNIGRRFWNMRKIIINCYAGQGNSLVLYR